MTRSFVVPLVLSAMLALSPSARPAAAAPTDAAARALRAGDDASALAQLRPLAAAGDREAEFLLGRMYDTGRGVPQDPAAAASWYRMAAAQGHALASLYLGMALYAGAGVKQDRAAAARLFRVAADSGNAQAQFYLGGMSMAGIGVAQNHEEAIRRLSQSAAQQNARAMGLLASELFARSEGKREQDLIDAYVWSHLAAELDPAHADTTGLRATERQLNAEQTARAQASMTEWKRRWSVMAMR